MYTRRILTVTLAVVAATACNPFHQDPAVQVTTKDAKLNSRWHANLASPASLAGVVQMNGSATMAPGANANTTRITLNLANAAPGGVHPWSAHWGQCGDGMDNGILGAGSAYRPLKVDSDGLAEGTASVTLETPETGSYFVVVQASEANPETIVACGNLAPPS